VSVVLRSKRRAADDDRIRSGNRDERVISALRILSHPWESVGVAEPDQELLVHVDGPADATHAPNDIRSPVAKRHEIGDFDLSRCRHPVGDEHEGVFDVFLDAKRHRPILTVSFRI
jgi:hypothetical protein